MLLQLICSLLKLFVSEEGIICRNCRVRCSSFCIGVYVFLTLFNLYLLPAVTCLFIYTVVCLQGERDGGSFYCGGGGGGADLLFVLRK